MRRIKYEKNFYNPIKTKKLVFKEPSACPVAVSITCLETNANQTETTERNALHPTKTNKGNKTHLPL